MGWVGRWRRMIDNKDTDVLQPCKSKYACGNYFYHTEYTECELCRTKDMC